LRVKKHIESVKQQQKQFINMIHGISCYMLPSVVELLEAQCDLSRCRNTGRNYV